MPVKFRPASATGAARGLAVVEGEGATAEGAAARAAAERAAQNAGRPRVTRFEVVDPATGEVRVVQRAVPRFSAERTAEQSARAEALRRHAGTPAEDPREWFQPESVGPSSLLPTATRDPLQALREKADSFGWSKRAADAWYRRMAKEYEDIAKPPPVGPRRAPDGLLDAFEHKYGWRPETEEAALRMLSLQALEELGFPPGS